MAVSAFTVANIKPSLNIDSAQRFIFGLDGFPEPLGAFKLDNIFVPVVGIPAVTNFETRNNTLSGFRWIQTTTNTDTHGSLRLQSFINAQPTGTDILFFNNDNTVVINNLSATSPFYINYNAPLSALYLRGPSSTQAGFVYSNTIGETRLFGANDLRISSTSGVIHLGFGAGTDDTITINTQSFTSIVDLIANNPDTSGFIPEKGLIFKTLGNQRGALTFDNVNNQLKLYTTTNNPIVIATNNTNALQVLTTGNIDLLSHRITNAANPVNAQDYATKSYVDSIVITPNITITGAVSGAGVGTINTVFNPSQSIIGDTQLFSYNANPIARFGIINLRVPTVGVPCFTTLDLTSSSNNGYKFLTTFSTTDTNGLGQFALQAISSSSIVTNIFSVLFSGSVPTTTFNGPLSLSNNRITNLSNPFSPQDAVTKSYVDASIGFVPSTVSVSGSTQTFIYPTNFNTRFVVRNNTAPISLNPSSMSLDLFNNTNAGYRFKHQITVSDLIGNMKLLYVNTLGNESEFLTVDFSALSVPQVTINGTFIAAGNSTMQYTAFNGDALFNQGCYVQTPTLSGQAANKQYVDDAVSNYASSNPVSLTGAVTGINSIGNPIFTSFANTIPVSGANQIFNFSLNSNVVYRLNNNLAATIGTPSTIALSLNNATNGGYRFIHTSTSTDPAGLGTLKLQALNSSGVTADVFTASVNTGTGITDTLFNGTATFNNAVTVQNNQSILVTGNSSTADYLVMNNTNVTSKTQLRINLTGLPVATFGYDGAASQVYIDSPFGAGSPFVIKFAGTTKFSIDNSTGNINLFSSRITNASNPVNAQDYATKNYVDNLSSNIPNTINVTGTTQTFNYSNLLTTSILSLVNTNPSALTRFRAGTSTDYLEAGYDGNAGYSYINIAQFSNDRLAFRVNGTGIGAFLASGLFGFGTITPTTAKVEVVGGVQNIAGEQSAIRIISNLTSVKLELQNTSASGKLYELRSNSDGSFGILDRTAATNRIVINTSGNIGIGGNTIPNAALQFGNVIANRRLVLYDSNNTDHQYYGFGINGGILRYQVDQLTSDHVFYAGTSSTTSNELYRVKGNGDTITAGTIYGRLVSGTMTMQNNAVGTTVTTANTFYKVAGTTTSSNLNGLTSSLANRLTVTSSISHIALINVSFTASHNGAGGEETTFALYKNGLQLANTLISSQQLNNLQVLSINTTVPMTTNDFIELWCTSPNNGRIITVRRLLFTYTTT